MGNSPSSTALADAHTKCAHLQDLFQQCSDKFEAEQKKKNGGREGYQNLGGFAASPCQVLFDDYNECISDHMREHVKSLRSNK